MSRRSFSVLSWLLILFIANVFIQINLHTPTNFEPRGEPVYEVTHQTMLDACQVYCPCGFQVELVEYDDASAMEWGWTTFDEDREVFIVNIQKSAYSETVIHEYTHVLVWNLPLETDHGPVFWSVYGELYRNLISE